MKKTQFLFSLTLCLAMLSCSNNDDDAGTNNKGYCNVTLLGETTHHEFDEGLTFSLGADNCSDNTELRQQNVEQFEKADYFLDVYLNHNETQQKFEGYNIANTVAKSYLDITSCYNNFDLIVEYTDNANDDTLAFNSASNNFNQILDISVYSENSEEIIYAVKGKFEVTFKKADNTLVPVIGDYKTFIYVLK